ncbi:hypothetical protein [Caldibacillus debilis]|uniref:hypothetical protein n=1 Tax=Caldibacillus debilis TaxID=301148 RepID=UPI0023F0F597|nr:hypothetical protein [Caldibacillus debilis]
MSTLQELLPVEMVGRVFSAIAGAVSMAGPLGALLGGFLGNMFGSSIVYSFGIRAMLPVSVQWFIDPLLRNIPNPRKMDPVKYGLSRHTALNRQYGKTRK